jgi:hypothetical protein
MTPDVSIYDHIKEYIDNVYFNRFPQGITLRNATPRVLIRNISETVQDDKDKKGRYEVIYRVECVGTNYMNCKAVANEIRYLLLNFTDSWIYLATFESEEYDTDDTAELFMVQTDYRVFINYVQL